MLPCLTHSFPTRRSSDLPWTADLRPRAGEPLAPFLGRFGGNVGHGVSDAQTGARVSLPFAGPALDELGKGRISYRQIDHQGHQLIPSGAGLGGETLALEAQHLDRKSTRLNSSH